MIIILMGVSGSEKSTIWQRQRLARELGWIFTDAANEPEWIVSQIRDNLLTII